MNRNPEDGLDAWQIAAIEQGVRDANAGRVVSHEAVVVWVTSWGRPNDNELPMPKQNRLPGESRDPPVRLPSA